MLNHFTITPSIESGLFSLGAATVTGILTWLGGSKEGKAKGRAEFINAVERAAELVITRLEDQIERVSKMHRECEESKSLLAAQVEFLMKEGPLPIYHMNKDKFDG